MTTMTDKSVLIVYGTKYGATAGIAKKLAEVIQKKYSVTITSFSDAPNPSDFQYVVLGSAVYIGKWRKEAEKYLVHFSQVLVDRMVWLFSSGPTGSDDPVKTMKGWIFPQNLKQVADQINPKDTVLFHGALDMKKCSFFERMIIRGIKAPTGDFRNWAQIESWAESILCSIDE